MRSERYEQARLRKIAKHATGRTVLDIGYAQIPNPYLGGYHRVGYDLDTPSPGSIRYEEEIQGDVADITSALHGRTFDTIICAELIEHLENPYEFLRRIKTLLRPEGRLILTTPNPLGFPVALLELFMVRRFFYTRQHLYYFLPRWAVRLIEGAGYNVEAIKAVGWWLPFGVLGWCPVICSYQVIYVATPRNT
jgi:SAM-dependent methyltransferase